MLPRHNNMGWDNSNVYGNLFPNKGNSTGMYLVIACICCMCSSFLAGIFWIWWSSKDSFEASNEDRFWLQ